MATLSLCMIVKNEEEVLERCLNSVKDAIDELVIVNTGSIDCTKEIAINFNANIYDFDWVDDFSAARNFAFSKATKEYIMWLDADDVLNPADLVKLKAIKNNLDGKVSQVAALYNVGFDELGNVNMSYYRERIFKNDKSFIWVGEVHECIALAKDVLYSDFAVTHAKTKPTLAGRNLKIYETIKQKRELNLREQYYYARELYYNNFIEKALNEFDMFLKSDGWIVNKIDACGMLSKCYLKNNDIENAKKALFNSFLFSEPNADVCCEIGKLFMEQQNYKTAIFWYSIALNRVPDVKNGSFVNIDSHAFTPSIQLCVCYDRIGDVETGNRFNELAATFKPKSKAVEQNRIYFERTLKPKT